MKVKDTLEMDLILASLTNKLMNFVGANRCLGSWDRHTAIESVKKTFPSWQYTGVAPLEDIMLWCEQHLGNDWIWNWETIYFRRECDRTAFLLRWA